jgi:hypothetical protein
VADLTRREDLEAARDHLRSLLGDESDGAKAAAVSRELRAVLTELEKLGAGRTSSRVDDLAAKRATRLAKAKGPGPSSARQ